MKNFADKVALITGAGSGIGRALAEELADEGCNLALVDWNNESLEETKNLIRKKNVSVSTHVLDIKDKEKIKELPQKVIDFHNQIDIVINNAGISVIGSVEEVNEDDWSFGLDTLLNSVIQMTTEFLPHLQKQKEAALVNVSSILAYLVSQNSPYIM